MREADPILEKQNNMCEETPSYCSQCGWPGTGVMPAGVSVISEKGKTVLAGKLSYFRINTALCSVCQEMQAAMASKQWFVEAHAPADVGS